MAELEIPNDSLLQSVKASRPVKVLIVDDSAVIRQVLARELSHDPEIEVVGTAGDPFIARDKILRHKPDVLTLDIEMPRMDGLTFLKTLMTHHPIPVIVLTSMAEGGATVAIEALENGALEVIQKPSCDSRGALADMISRLSEAIKAASLAKLRSSSEAHPRCYHSKAVAAEGRVLTSERIIAVGTSTGGTEALKTVLTSLRSDCPSVLAVIHMPEGFTQRYAQRLNELCEIEVREARNGDCLRPGLALIGKGNSHLVLARSGANYVAELRNGPPVCRHRPSVEVLFKSVAHSAGRNAMGIVLTGMGNDGADGLLAMRNAGAYTVAQDEASCVIYGMPRQAVQRSAAIEVLPLDQIAGAAVRWCHTPTTGIHREGT